MVVAEGGYEFSEGNEINGISLVAVGSGTTMDYIQVESDDGIEFYGGNVNVKHGVFTNNLDDSVDWDEGSKATGTSSSNSHPTVQERLLRWIPGSRCAAFKTDIVERHYCGRQTEADDPHPKFQKGFGRFLPQHISCSRFRKQHAN